MSLNCIPRALGIVCVLLLAASAQNPVHIQYSNDVSQLLTSSTLAWIPHSQFYNNKIPRDIVIGGFEIIEQIVRTSDNDTAKTITKEVPIYVCRVQHEGTWVTGSQKQGDRKCTVGFMGNQRSYDRYDLLENVDSAGRLSWTSWNKFTLPPNGMVAVHEEKLYVARHSVMKPQNDNSEVTKYISHCIGTFTQEEGFGKIFCALDSGSQNVFEGEILVETEPKRYDLTQVKLNTNKMRVLKSVPKILGQATIKNPGPKKEKMAEALSYSYNYMIYWGQIRAMSKGLDTSIKLQNGTSLSNVKWGTEVRGNQTVLHSVDIILEPGTGVNVTLKGNYAETELYYSGDLISHYEDGATKTRSINGFRREEGMIDVVAEFSPIFFLSNFSIVPTTEAPPTTTTTTMRPTTTIPMTIPTTKRVPQPPILMGGIDEKVSKVEEMDENIIVPPKKTELMHGGDEGPLSLKDRSENERSSTTNLVPQFIYVLLLILCVDRIT